MIKDLLSIITKEEKLKLRQFFFMLILITLCEFVAISAIFPYLMVLGEKENIHKSKFLHGIYKFYNFESVDTFIFALGMVIVGFIVLKGILMVFDLRMKARFSYYLHIRLASKVLRSYTERPYCESMLLNSTSMSKNLILEILQVVILVAQMLTMVTDIFLTMAILSIMVLLNPQIVSIITISFGLFIYIAIQFSKNKTQTIGRKTEKYNKKLYQYAAECFAGIKDIQVYNVCSFFQEKTLSPLKKVAELKYQYSILSEVPNIIMQILVFGGLMIVLLYLLQIKYNLIEVIPVISIVAISIQRILPSVTRIYNAYGLVRRYSSSITIIKSHLGRTEDMDNVGKIIGEERKHLSFQKGLLLKSIYYRYPETVDDVLSGVTLEIKKHKSLGIVGSSGAGKSTLADVLLGLLTTDRGEIWCDDTLITAENRLLLRKLIGYVPQQTFLLDDTIEHNIAFGVADDQIDDEKLNNAIVIAQLDKIIDTLQDGKKTVIGERGIKFSGGQRQRIGIARALYHDPEILIMDEATNSLDAITEAEFNQALISLMLKKTLVIIAHRISSLSICDSLAVLENGRVVSAGTYQNLKQDSEAFRNLFRIMETSESTVL